MQDREEFRREVPCLDTADRPRVLQVFVSGKGHIVIQAPPGEVAQLAPSGIQRFHEVVTEAHIEAMKVRQSS